MPVGLTATIGKQDIDRRAGQLVVQLENILSEIQKFNEYLGTFTDAELEAFGAYSAEERQLLKGSFIDLENLRLTAYGQRAQSPANNFLYNATKLTGWQ